jgi:hypothetical protein
MFRALAALYGDQAEISSEFAWLSGDHTHPRLSLAVQLGHIKSPELVRDAARLLCRYRPKLRDGERELRAWRRWLVSFSAGMIVEAQRAGVELDVPAWRNAALKWLDEHLAPWRTAK